MPKKSNHTQAILDLVGSADNITTSDVAEALKLSSSRARELLAIELKAGTIDRHHADVDGCKVLVYTIKGDGPEEFPDKLNRLKAEVEAEKSDKPAKTTKPTKAPKKAKTPAAPKTKVVKTPKDKKPRRKASGAGKPNAKKVVNPQQTLDLKKAMIERNNGKMVWQNRMWSITVAGETTQMKSRDLAKHTLESLAKDLGLTV